MGRLCMRLRRICDSERTLEMRLDDLKDFLMKRGYNCEFVGESI